MFQNKFKNKIVLVTGHTGFKGSWLCIWLTILGAKVIGISIGIPTIPSLFKVAKLSNLITDLRFDIRNKSKLIKTIVEIQPDFVFHLAAQSLVRDSYSDPINTWTTNVIGTLNLLEGLRHLDKKCTAIIVSTDKCYENKEWVFGYRENDNLGGNDPYSASKGAMEIALNSYIKSFFSDKNNKIRIASVRAGNVIGGGDWAKDRIIPDCVRAWSEQEKVFIRNPSSTRPWQHVLEPLNGYLQLASKLNSDKSLHGFSFNFGPNINQNSSVLDLVKSMSKVWDDVQWIENKKIDKYQPHEANLLMLNCDKAYHYLSWQPVMSFHETVKVTAEWYKKYYLDKDKIFEFTKAQISYFASQIK